MKKIICLLGIITMLCVVSLPAFADPYPEPPEQLRTVIIPPITLTTTIQK